MDAMQMNVSFSLFYAENRSVLSCHKFNGGFLITFPFETQQGLESISKTSILHTFKFEQVFQALHSKGKISK